MNIGALCSRHVADAVPTMPLPEAAQIMRARHVGCLVVVAEKDGITVPIGMLTDRDIVVGAVATGADPATLTVGDLMTPGVIVARPEDSVSATWAAMREMGIRRLPVVDERGQLIGIIAADDMLELAAQGLGDFVQTVRAERLKEIRLRSS